MATSARRGHGEGSVYRDAANSTWVGAMKTEVRDKLKKLQAETDAVTSSAR